MEQKGLSPMVATIVLIGLVMVIAGVLAAGLSGGTPQAPKNARIGVDDLSPDTTTITLSHNGGDDLLKAFGLTDDDNFVPNQVDVRLNGQSLKGENVATLTTNGTPYDDAKSESRENIDFVVGDILVFDNLTKSVSSGDSFTVIWTPNDQMLLSTEV